MLLAFLDLDGTSLNRKGKLGSLAKAVNKIQKLDNVEIIFSTGRTKNESQEIIKDVNTNYFIFENGSVIYRNDEIILERKFIESDLVLASKLALTKHNRMFYIEKSELPILEKSKTKLTWSYNKYNDKYEVTPEGASKGSAESYLASLLESSRTIHFGDGDNDKSTIKVVDQVYAIKGSALAEEKNVLIIKRRQITKILKENYESIFNKN